MIALLLAVVLSVVNNGEDWRVQFSPHSLNVGVEAYVSCYQGTKLVWQWPGYAHIEPDWNEVLIHRNDKGIPHGAHCVGTFDVKRNNDGATGDSSKDYSGESALIQWDEK